MSNMEASKKRVRSFSQQELTFFREGRKAAREGFSLSSNRDSENPYFVRGFNQERLLIRSEAGEILLVRGMAVVCSRCSELHLYNVPGCPCWNTEEVKALAAWMNSGLPREPWSDTLIKQYRLTYGVLLHRSTQGQFVFVEMNRYLDASRHLALPAFVFPTGEPFFLGPFTS
jgi:hypothetical protein